MENKGIVAFFAGRVEWLILTAVILSYGGYALENPSGISPQIASFLENSNDNYLGEPLRSAKLVSVFYRDRGNRPAWVTESGVLSPAAELLISMIDKAAENGLHPEDYHSVLLRKLTNPQKLSPANRDLGLEVLLTDALFTLSGHLQAGFIDAKSVNPDWDIRRKKINLMKQIEKAFEDETIIDYLNTLEPQSTRYQRLKNALQSYQLMRRFPVIEGKAPLRLGNRGARVLQLKKRLVAEGFLDPDLAEGNDFDKDLRHAVMVFQQTHGVWSTGVVDRKTIAELNVPLAFRIRELQVNLERLRWMPRDPEDTYVLVDITDFKLGLFRSEKPVLEMRAIVGDDKGHTPIMNAKIQSVALNPSWRIPKRIVLKEIVPKLVQDPSYLKKRGIKVSAVVSGQRTELDTESIDWSLYKGEESFFLFEAPSGPANPMGMVKFIFPNDLNVYLHGTPDGHLFGQENRSLSHGCVRVEDPIDLAVQLLKGSVWNDNRLRELIKSGSSFSLDLVAPVPVHLLYRTAWMDEDHHVQFRPDIYHWDDQLWRALNNFPRSPQPPVVVSNSTTN